MKIFPAIDLRGGRCVRLRQGRAEDETVYSDDPVRMALSWQEQGAEFLHVVDLDGAFAGRPVHTDLFRALAAGVDRMLLPAIDSASVAAMRSLALTHPSHFRLMQRGASGMDCLVHGDPARLRPLVGKAVSVRGKAYAVTETDLPVVVVGDISPAP